MTTPTTPTRSSEALKHPAAANEQNASEIAIACAKEYAREHPEVIAMWAFGIGFVLGWKLKPW